MLNRRHEVLAVRLWDPREVDLPDIGLVLMQDAETGEQLWVDTHDRRFRQRFHEAAARREAALDAAFRHAGVDVLSLSTEDDLVRAIVAVRRTAQAEKAASPAPAPSHVELHEATIVRRRMEFTWPQMLWALLLLPVLVVGLHPAAAPTAALRPALCQPFAGQGGAGTGTGLAPARAAGALPR